MNVTHYYQNVNNKTIINILCKLFEGEGVCQNLHLIMSGGNI